MSESAKIIPSGSADKALWLANFCIKLALFAERYHLSPDEVADMMASSKYYSYVVERHRQMEEYKRNLTAYRDELSDGALRFGVILPFPALPEFAPIPPSVPNGIFKRVTALAQRIKKHIAYNEADGLDLGIVADKRSIVRQKAKASCTIRLIEGGHPEIVWKKGGMDGVEIWVKRHVAESDFKFLAYDQRPNYTDMHPLPPSGESAVWQYKLIYRYQDRQAGTWSDVVSVTVGML